MCHGTDELECVYAERFNVYIAKRATLTSLIERVCHL